MIGHDDDGHAPFVPDPSADPRQTTRPGPAFDPYATPATEDGGDVPPPPRPRMAPHLTLDPSDRLRGSSQPPRRGRPAPADTGRPGFFAASPPPGGFAASPPTGDGPRPPRPPKPPRPPGPGKWGPGSWRRRWTKRLVLWTITLGIWGCIALAGVLAWYGHDLPDIDQVTAPTRRPSVQLVSADGELFASFGDLYGETLDLGDIAPTVAQAVMATEDRRFFDHFGLDMIGLLRAAVVNLRAGHVVQGGSTITQQLAKNLFLKPDRTLKRKVQELLMALWLEHRFTKNQLLTLYLNRVYLGSGTYGVDAAAKRYFDVSARQLNLYQSAVIAGLLKAPSRYSPLNDPEASRKRTRDVLQNMVEAGYIDQRTADLAALTGAAQPGKRPQTAGRYFADYIAARLEDIGEVQGRDIVVHTTINLGLERSVEAQIKDMLDGPGAKANVGQSAVVIMTPTGAIRALAGGKDYDESQFNRAVQGLRQPGSSFKPFVYLTAMEQGLSPRDIYDDAPIKLGNWQPGNYNGRFEGAMTLRHAFANSTNTVAVRLIEAVGPARVIATAQKLGISSPLGRDASLALGTSETSLLELTQAYAPFANGGFGIAAYGIDTITDPNGSVLWTRRGAGFGRVISDQALAKMHELMGAVMTEGTGKGARLDRPAAGKSGTTQDYRDAWFMGFTADYVAGVWMGNDDQRNPMKKVTGGGMPAQLWKGVMIAAHQGVPVHPLPTPDLAPPQGAETEGTMGGVVAQGQGANPVKSLGNAIDDLINSIFGH